MSGEETIGRTGSEPVGWCYRADVDVLSDKDGLLVVADMPGARSQDIDVRFEAGVLTIHGAVRPRAERERQYMVQEYGVGDFERRLRIDEHIDVAGIEAQCADGVLKVRLPKAASARPRQIPVKAP